MQRHPQRRNVSFGALSFQIRLSDAPQLSKARFYLLPPAPDPDGQSCPTIRGPRPVPTVLDIILFLRPSFPKCFGVQDHNPFWAIRGAAIGVNRQRGRRMLDLGH